VQARQTARQARDQVDPDEFGAPHGEHAIAVRIVAERADEIRTFRPGQPGQYTAMSRRWARSAVALR
jgi:hypothetical protein